MTNVWNGNVNGSPWQLLRADQNDSSFIQKEIYRLSPQHFSSMFPLSSNAHCGPETRWGQKTKHQEPFCYPSQLPSPEQMMASGVYQTGNTHKPRWLFFVMFQIRRGTIIKPLMLVLFLRNKQFLNYLQAALRGYVKPGHWNHFTKLDLTNTALQSLTSINKCVRKPLALKGKDT